MGIPHFIYPFISEWIFVLFTNIRGCYKYIKIHVQILGRHSLLGIYLGI